MEKPVTWTSDPVDGPMFPPGRALPKHLVPYRDQGVWRNVTLAHMAADRARLMPNAAAVIDGNITYSFGQLWDDARALAAGLTGLGLATGDVISFQLPNWYEAAVINLAASFKGLVVNPIVPIYRDTEVTQMLGDCGSKVIFLTERFRNFDFATMMERIRPKLPALKHIIYLRGERGSTSYEALLNDGRGGPLVPMVTDADAVKLLLYTSGTTGKPKAVLHSQNTLTRTIDTLSRNWAIMEGDALLVPSPVTHVSGYANGLEMPFVTGTASVMMESWKADLALDLIERHRIVGTIAATPFLMELVHGAKAAGTRLPSLHFFACGGAAVPPDIIRDANRTFARPCSFRIFGSSEAPLTTVGFLGAGKEELAATTDGEIVDYDIRIVNDQGQNVKPGSEGEILVHGPAMFLGYADETHTDEAITDEGYFRTGDLGIVTRDNGIVITGRKKDLIIRGGENISAKEVEDALHRHPAVSEAAVISIPHMRLGEGVGAYIVLCDGQHVAPDMLVKFVAEGGLAMQKCPERVEFVTALPKTASGKVRKDILRAQARATISTTA